MFFHLERFGHFSLFQMSSSLVWSSLFIYGNILDAILGVFTPTNVENSRSSTISSCVENCKALIQLCFFPDTIFSLIILDPDVPFATAATEEKPLLHGLYVNIMNGNFSTGIVFDIAH